jgi:hypothetical protein
MKERTVQRLIALGEKAHDEVIEALDSDGITQVQAERITKHAKQAQPEALRALQDAAPGRTPPRERPSMQTGRERALHACDALAEFAERSRHDTADELRDLVTQVRASIEKLLSQAPADVAPEPYAVSSDAPISPEADPGAGAALHPASEQVAPPTSVTSSPEERAA